MSNNLLVAFCRGLDPDTNSKYPYVLGYMIDFLFRYYFVLGVFWLLHREPMPLLILGIILTMELLKLRLKR